MNPSVTKDGRPIVYPTNALTQLLTENRGRGGVSASPPPSVRSGAWGAQPLTQEEQAELDAKLAGVSAPTEAVGFRQMQEIVPRQRGSLNFNNIQGINLEQNTIRVDGLDFPLAPEDVHNLRLLCVDCVLNAVVLGLREMLGTSGIEVSSLLKSLKEDVIGRGDEAQALQEGQELPRQGEDEEGSVEGA